MPRQVPLKTVLLTGAAMVVLSVHAQAQSDAAASPSVQVGTTADTSPAAEEIVVTAPSPHAELTLGGTEMQKIQPGVAPMAAVAYLPGVVYESSDPWGNSENNQSIFVHGFSLSQLGYTMDGVPLGDQSFGNYNGLSPQRAIISENVDHVAFSSGAGDLGTASTSNLGGTLETFSSDPKTTPGAAVSQTFGSYGALRTYARVDSGDIDGTRGYISFDRQFSNTWDYNLEQGGYQVNAKVVHERGDGTLTAFFDWNNKNEPSEDSVNYTAAPGAPYFRQPFYPDLTAAEAYVNAKGLPPTAAGSNYRNYFSDNQREDVLGYLRYDYMPSGAFLWSNTVYAHHDDGIGLTAQPVGEFAVSGKDILSFYFPGANPVQVAGGTGYAMRATTYSIDREGLISTAKYTIGSNDIEVGGWVEHYDDTNDRQYFAVTAATTPFGSPGSPLFTQAELQNSTTVLQSHIQDTWHVLEHLDFQAGFKSSLQYADGTVAIQPILGSYSGASGNLPSGSIDTSEAFLPQFGALWHISQTDQLFANIQKNMQDYVTYGLSAGSPWALGSQAAFNLFKQTGQPQTDWTYDLGWRGNHKLDVPLISGIDGQINYYHVDFSNRLLAISPNSVVSAAVGGVSILDNVGGVTTDGVDVAATVHFGAHFSFYDGLSYNHSTYDANYVSGKTTILTAGKIVPGDPTWMNKSILSTQWDDFDAQLGAQFIGKRYATYTNDLSVKPYSLFDLEVGYNIGAALLSQTALKHLRAQLNVYNLTDTKAVSTLVVGAASGTYAGYPMAPRQVFFTLSESF